MKQVVIKLIAPLLCLIGLWSCSDDEPSLSPDNKQWTEKVVAVVLPMEKGLDVHWKRTLGMFTTNFERAFKNHEAGIRLKFEYYDEAKTDVRELARSLAFNDEVYAVIGGLYSSNAAILGGTDYCGQNILHSRHRRTTGSCIRIDRLSLGDDRDRHYAM
jgi:hypothetical protein